MHLRRREDRGNGWKRWKRWKRLETVAQNPHHPPATTTTWPQRQRRHQPSDGLWGEGQVCRELMSSPEANFSDFVHRIAPAGTLVPSYRPAMKRSNRAGAARPDLLQACLGEHSHEILQHIRATPMSGSTSGMTVARAAETETISSTSRPRVAYFRYLISAVSSRRMPLVELVSRPITGERRAHRRSTRPFPVSISTSGGSESHTAVRFEPPLERLESPMELGAEGRSLPRVPLTGELADAHPTGPAVRRTPTGSGTSVSKDALTTRNRSSRHRDRYSAYERAAPFRPGAGRFEDGARDRRSSSTAVDHVVGQGLANMAREGCRMRPDAHVEVADPQRVRGHPHETAERVESPARSGLGSPASSSRTSPGLAVPERGAGDQPSPHAPRARVQRRLVPPSEPLCQRMVLRSSAICSSGVRPSTPPPQTPVAVGLSTCTFLWISSCTREPCRRPPPTRRWEARAAPCLL